MSLFIVATPIGNPDDISLRALKILKSSDLIIGEEAKVARQILGQYELKEQFANLRTLNEHTDKDEVEELVELCRTKNVALISDAGTPSFCDPGFKLVQACRKQKIQVLTAPGASSLMTLISLSSRELKSFHFLGFLPKEKSARTGMIKHIEKNSQEAFVLMDTPYRLKQTLEEVKALGNRECLLGLDLTMDDEILIEIAAKNLIDTVKTEKAEFVLLVYPK
jgi:16S rRNA (cytidine1402-2'-O)-methyltransferase